jgi:prepilin-type N-terminal cleavage/methylation domain-containing protein
MRRTNGFALIEVIVAAGILAIVSLGVAQVITNMAKEQRSLTEKFGILDMQNTMMTALSNPDVCYAQLSLMMNSVNLSGATTTQASSTIVNFTSLRVGTSLDSPLIALVGQAVPGFAPAQMNVESIQLSNIKYAGFNNTYFADFSVNVNQNTLVRSLKPATMKLTFSVNPNPTLATAQLVSCGSGYTHVGDWSTLASGTVYMSPSDGFVVATACYDCGLRISTAPSVNNSCGGVALTQRVMVSARDKYGQGFEDASLVLKKGECWIVETLNKQANPVAQASQVQFRPM